MHFALVFPDRPNAWVRSEQGTKLLPLIYVPAALLGAGRIAMLVRGGSGDAFSGLMTRLDMLELLHLSISLIAGLAIMVRTLNRLRSVTAKRQLRWIVWGTAIGAVVADHLKMPSLTQVIKMDVADGKLTCQRQAEYGYDTVEVDLPAVISVGDAINEPRYPSLKAIMGAKKKPLEAKAAGDVGIEGDKVGEAGSRTAVLAINPPPEKEAGQIIEDEDTDETVEKIVSWLEERKLLA